MARCSLCAARILLAIQAVCRNWRNALVTASEDLWRHFTLAAFPRVSAILSARPASGAFCWRDVYRSQARAQRLPPRPTDGRPALPQPTCELSHYVFTFELSIRGVKATWTGNVLAKLGQYRHGLPSLHLEMPAGVRLWQKPPIALCELVQLSRWTDDDTSDIRVSILVTDGQMRTVRLVDGETLQEYDDRLEQFHFDMAQLPIKSNRLARDLFFTDAPLTLRCLLHLRTGQMELNPSVDMAPENDTSMDCFDMTMPQMLTYLERCVPWDGVVSCPI